jgi:hypothetical protein
MIVKLNARRGPPRSVHLYQSMHDQRRFVANLRFADGRVESYEIPEEREAMELAALWSEQGAGVTLAWIDPDDEAEKGPGGAA